MGFAVVQQTVELRLDLRPADPARWLVQAAAGYELAEWTGSAPDELLLSYAAARNAIREAPHDGLSFTEPEWTAQRVRDEETTAAARGCELRVVAAIHQPTAQVAGLTYLEVYQHRPELAVQQDTAVLPAHRGHGLGVWMKAANLRRLTAAHPEVTGVITSNAADNEHMLRVNQQVGFRPRARTEIREARLSELAARLLR
jgi:mycothiol synthase